MPEYLTFFAELKVQRADGLISVRDNGTEWLSEKEMQTRPLAARPGAGWKDRLRHHSYAACGSATGPTTQRSPALIGEKSLRMGTHYTRHVEDEVNITRAFNRLKDGT